MSGRCVRMMRITSELKCMLQRLIDDKVPELDLTRDAS